MKRWSINVKALFLWFCAGALMFLAFYMRDVVYVPNMRSLCLSPAIIWLAGYYLCHSRNQSVGSFMLGMTLPASAMFAVAAVLVSPGLEHRSYYRDNVLYAKTFLANPLDRYESLAEEQRVWSHVSHTVRGQKVRVTVEATFRYRLTGADLERLRGQKKALAAAVQAHCTAVLEAQAREVLVETSEQQFLRLQKWSCQLREVRLPDDSLEGLSLPDRTITFTLEP